MAPSIVNIANEKASIVIACRMAGTDVSDVDGYGGSMKIFCPFGGLHSDGGHEKAMRIYPDTNSAWCFACQSFYTPVKMVAEARHVDQGTAAAALLERIGYQPPSVDEQWADVQRKSILPDAGQLADALKIYCERVVPRWRVRQFDAGPAQLLTKCLRLLDLVRTDEEAQLWLNTAKRVMCRELTGTNPCSN